MNFVFCVNEVVCFIFDKYIFFEDLFFVIESYVVKFKMEISCY